MPDLRPSEPPALHEDEIAELSRQFIVHFYRYDDQWCTTHCMPDVTCLGSLHDILAEGINSLRYVITNYLEQLHPSLVMSIDTKVRQIPGGQSLLVLAAYCLITDPASGDVQAAKKRATLLWVMTEAGPRLQHIQFSTPMYSSNESETLTGDAHETYVYANVLLEQVIRRSAVPLQDVQGTLWSVAASEVRYIEASRQQCIVHCMEHDILVRRGFADLVRQFEGKLVVVHRSFAVNPAYVRSASAAGIVLDNGTHVPMPQRRVKEVRAKLEQAMQKTALSNMLNELPLTLAYRQATAY